MSKHTPGPWEVVLPDNWYCSASAEARITATSSNPIVARVPQRLTDEKDASYNAHLIAASPCLLGICQTISEALDRQYGKEGYYLSDQTVDALNRAIAKAKGEE